MQFSGVIDAISQSGFCFSSCIFHLLMAKLAVNKSYFVYRFTSTFVLLLSYKCLMSRFRLFLSFALCRNSQSVNVINNLLSPNIVDTNPFPLTVVVAEHSQLSLSNSRSHRYAYAKPIDLHADFPFTGLLSINPFTFHIHTRLTSECVSLRRPSNKCWSFIISR